MLPLSYAVSLDLEETLGRIDALRTKVLTTPISPKTELRHRFEAMIDRLYATSYLADIPVSKKLIIKCLRGQPVKTTRESVIITRLHTTYRTIFSDWVASNKDITYNTIESLALSALPMDQTAIKRALRAQEPHIRELMGFLETKIEHPVIQASIAHTILSTHAIIAGDFGRVARIVSTLYLTKHGYDLRAMLAPEAIWMSQESSYELSFSSVDKQNNLNHSLLYFATTICNSMEKLAIDLTDSRFHSEFPSSFWELNDRQKLILSTTEDTNISLTNMMIQKLCKSSQVTASRDLAKLVSLGLLYPHGKGRSVYYTRV
jgi:hypothetical protein